MEGNVLILSRCRSSTYEVPEVVKDVHVKIWSGVHCQSEKDGKMY